MKFAEEIEVILKNIKIPTNPTLQAQHALTLFCKQTSTTSQKLLPDHNRPNMKIKTHVHYGKQ